MKAIASEYTKLFWHEYKLNPKRSDYNIVFDQAITGELDIKCLSFGLLTLIQDHIILNSHLVENNDQLFWQTNTDIYTLQVYKESSHTLQLEFVTRPFELDKDPLYRFGLFYKSENAYDFIMVLHHAVIDGSSMDEFIDLISKYYKNSAQINNQKKQLREISTNNEDLNHKAKVVKNKESLDFWKNAFSSATPQNNFIYYKNSIAATNQISSETFTINKKIFTKENSAKLATKFSTILGIWSLVNARYCNEADVLVAFPINIGLNDGLKYGAQTNTILLPINFESTQIHMSHILDQIRSFIKSGISHKYTDLTLAEVLKVSPIQKINLACAKTNLKNKALEFANCKIQIQNRYDIDIAGSELLLLYEETANYLDFKILYRNDLFAKDYIRQLINTFLHIFRLIINNPNQSIAEINFLTQEEYNRLIYTWNQTDNDYAKDKLTISQLFEEQVAKTPDNIALVFENKKLTYKELNKKSNQLAYYLKRQYNVQGDDLIALCLNRSEYMIIAILAVLKSGGAYVPIDPNYPDERIKYILDDTQTKVVITDEMYAKRLSLINPSVDYCCINSSSLQMKTNKLSFDNLVNKITSNHLAYVIYTSGTTGASKGVMIEHKSIVNFIYSQHSVVMPSDIILSTINYSFDAINSDIYPALTQGSTLHIGSNDLISNYAKLYNYLIENKITFISMPALVISSIAEIFDLSKTNIKTIITGGETYSGKRDNGINYFNQYGPTETTVCATMHRYQRGDLNNNIGKTLPNLKAYILDQNLQPVPISAIGELYIGGLGLARGYLNQSNLTQERFIPNPFQTVTEKNLNLNSRIYKTGDLCKYLENGDIEYIGRNDEQIKIRGFRIELGEIENTLINYPGIKQAVVIIKEHKTFITPATLKNNNIHQIPNKKNSANIYIVAYYAATEKLNAGKILDYLKNKLPDYMLPVYLIALDKIPLTLNGKIDKKALPEPKLENQPSKYVEPTNKTEFEICKIWQEVLHIERVGVTDDFFKLGGNSIHAIQVAHKISQKFENKHIEVTLLFKHRTIRSLYKEILQNNLEQIFIPKINLKKHLLSFAEERLWFIEEYTGGTNAYHIPLFLEIFPQTKIKHVKQALKAIIRRHQILASVINVAADGLAYHKICKKNLLIPKQRFINKNKFARELKKIVNTPFDLKLEYPIKAFFYANTLAAKTYLIVNLHHIACDGWSIDIFYQELIAYYEYYANGKAVNLPELTIQYKDFAVWQRKYLSEARLKEQINYWTDRLTGHETLQFPIDKIRPKDIDYSGDDIDFSINKKISKELRVLAKTQGDTLYSLLLTAFYILLNHYTSQTDLVIGTPVANRDYPQTKDLIGFFVNSLVLREHININDSALDLLKQVRLHTVELQQYQDLPFAKLVDELKLKKDPSRHPVFQIMFGVQSFAGAYLATKYFKVADNLIKPKVAKYDLSLFIDDGQMELQGTLNYATSLFNKNTIKRLTQHYQVILAQLIKTPTKKISEYNLLNSKEYQQLVCTWNQTENSHIPNKTIHELFEEQVVKTPDNVALVYENKQLTYRELNEKSNQLANYLKAKHKVKNEELITLCLERNEYMLIAILGVLKAGGTYVPIDPKYPDERIKYILDDTKSRLIIINEAEAKRLSMINPFPKHCLIDNHSLIRSINNESGLNPKNHITGSNLAYIIYTSGTTGKPKGVMIEHKSVSNLIHAISYIYSLNFKAQVSFFTAYVFDVSVAQIFSTFLNGNTLHIMPELIRTDAHKITEFLLKNKINVCYLPRVMLGLIDKVDYPDLINIIYAGEECDVATGLYWSNTKNLYNYYGPTETTIYSVGKKVINGDVNLIGKPILNTLVYILNKNMAPVPIGVIGELYIGGKGLARGYLHQQELTQEKFIQNPFQTPLEKKLKINSRIYKTGDLVRYHENGNIEYIGRNDDQVKIRGFRIELGEIEATLSNYLGVTQAAVIVKEHQTLLESNEGRHNNIGGSKINQLTNLNKYLIVYYVATHKLDEEKILDYLKVKLPEYMVPTYLVAIDQLPLTLNGKIDKKSLPEIEFTHLTQNSNYIHPCNYLEITLCKIFAAVLGLNHNNLSIHDDFFKLGGNSILAMQLTYQINHALSTNISIADIFSGKTIANIANRCNDLFTPNLLKTFSNNSKSKKRLFFIHPSGAGCEVYVPIIEVIKTNYNIFGIDNYNLSHKPYIENLTHLARKYIDILPIKKHEQINLFGWSLGGHIALEMAYWLEQSGYKKIKVTLLDTLLPKSSRLNKILSPQKIEQFIKEMQKNKIINEESHTIQHWENVKATLPSEFKLTNSPISGKLNYTQVTLYQATLDKSKTQLSLREFHKFIQYLVVIPVSTTHFQIISDLRNIKII